MKIAACYKLVPVSESIAIKGDGSLDMSKADWQVGEYDFNGVTAGVQLAGESNGSVVAVTCGGEIVKNTKLLKAVLARGANEMVGVCDPACVGLDSYGTASVLKAIVESIGDVDLVITGEGSVDLYSQQVGAMMGELMGWTTINGVNKVNYVDGKLVAERNLETEVEMLEISLPAVISVTTSINKPKVPSMKDILAAGKKPNKIMDLAALGAVAENASEEISTLAPKKSDRKCEVLADSSEENIAAFAELIKKSI